MRRFVKVLTIVFGIWTLVALCNTADRYLLTQAVGEPEPIWGTLRRSLTEQWIWAALTPIVFLIARRFPLGRRPLTLAFSVHAACFLALCLVHCWLAVLVSGPLMYVPPHYQGSLVRLRLLEEFYSDIWMYWPLVCIQALIDSHARARERDRAAARLETELTRARLALLRAQIHPHFLFNTLHSIAALVRVDTSAAEDMVADLAEVLRASFADPSQQETTLARELELVRCYLRIQSCRFSDRLSLRYRVNSDTLDAAVPVLVLQSLVENAVMHGVSPAERPCTLEIGACRLEDRLLLTVADDGVGLHAAYRPGVGLYNARLRLLQLYGERQSLELTARGGGGAVATVSIPFRLLSLGGAHFAVEDENTSTDRGRRGAGETAPVVTVEP
jgi:two-component system LytT family sensor kinase